MSTNRSFDTICFIVAIEYDILLKHTLLVFNIYVYIGVYRDYCYDL